MGKNREKTNASQVKVEIEIDPKFSSLIPSLTPDEYEKLEESLVREGCRDPLVLWGKILVDGHNRYEICRKHNLTFNTHEKEFKSENEAINWIIDNQLGRRNLTAEQKNYLIGKKYEQLKDTHGGDRKTDQASGKSCHLKTETIVAEKYKVSPRKVRYAAEFSKAVDKLTESCGEDAKIKILSGDIKKSQFEITELAQAPLEEQQAVMSKLIEGKAKSIKESKKVVEEEQKIITVTKKTSFEPASQRTEIARWSWTPLVQGVKLAMVIDEEKLNSPDNTPLIQIESIVDKNVLVTPGIDPFGSNISKEESDKILETVEKANQWNFIFITNNYDRIKEIMFPSNAWVGTIIENPEFIPRAVSAFENLHAGVKFVQCDFSVESMRFENLDMFHWIIVDSSNPRSSIPWERLENILFQARRSGCKVMFTPNVKGKPEEYPDPEEIKKQFLLKQVEKQAAELLISESTIKTEHEEEETAFDSEEVEEDKEPEKELVLVAASGEIEEYEDDEEDIEDDQEYEEEEDEELDESDEDGEDDEEVEYEDEEDDDEEEYEEVEEEYDEDEEDEEVEEEYDEDEEDEDEEYEDDEEYEEEEEIDDDDDDDEEVEYEDDEDDDEEEYEEELEEDDEIEEGSNKEMTLEGFGSVPKDTEQSEEGKTDNELFDSQGDSEKHSIFSNVFSKIRGLWKEK
jgi:hypothetical protein